MRNRSGVSYFVLFGLTLLFAGLLFAQDIPDRALIVNGKAAGMAVEMGGHAYVDVEAIAQFTNGSVTFEPNQIVLTFPAPGSAAVRSSELAPMPPAPPPGLSRNFAGQAIAALAEMREWRGAIGTILIYGQQVVGTWPQDYHDRVEADISQVAISALTAADHDALLLLQNELANLSKWAGDVVSTRQSLNATNTVRPDALQSDPLLAKIADCGRFLNSMLVSGVFADNQSCH